jgi:exonuclease VII small subunit
MKAILEFDLDNGDDVIAHLRCVKSLDMANALFEITHNLRRRCERACENLGEDGDAYEGMVATFEEINDVLESCGVDMDELIN